MPDDNTYYSGKDNPKDRIEVEVGDSKVPGQFLPQLKIMRWDNEVNLSVRLVNNEQSPTTSSAGDKVTWDGSGVKAEWYPVTKKEPTVISEMRHVNLGSLSPEDMAASFDLFRVQKQTRAVALTYQPREETYWLAGMYAADRDLDMALVERPITRYRLFVTQSPVMFVDANTLIVDLVFPGRHLAPNVLNCIRSVLKDYGYEDRIEAAGRRLFFVKDGIRKKFCSSGWDENHFTLYVSLSAPTYDFERAYRQGKADYQRGGIDEIVKVAEHFGELLVDEIAKDLGLDLTTSDLNADEVKTIAQLSEAYSDKAWVETGDTEYTIPWELDLDDDGGHEFEIILKAKPSSNVIQFTLNTKGLDFFYQPEPTADEKFRGVTRAANVIGSYAVYASENKVNYDGGKEYRCGKVCHIFRPKISDATGVWVWGELKVDIDLGLLYVTIPQDFLDNATYPVTHAAGATFGFTSAGANPDGIGDYIFGSLFTGAAGTGSSMGVYVYTNDSEASKCNVYVHSTLAPLANGSTVEKASVVTGLNTYNFTSAPTFTAIDYVLVAWSYLDCSGVQIMHDAGATNQSHGKSATYGAWPNPISSPTHGAYKFSIFCTYTPTGGFAHSQAVIV
jgi:hypothetical protein